MLGSLMTIEGIMINKAYLVSKFLENSWFGAEGRQVSKQRQ